MSPFTEPLDQQYSKGGQTLLKPIVSENPSTSNMVKGTKHCYNLKDTSFTIFIDDCGHNWAGKSVSFRYAKF